MVTESTSESPINESPAAETVRRMRRATVWASGILTPIAAIYLVVTLAMARDISTGDVAGASIATLIATVAVIGALVTLAAERGQKL